MTSLIKHFFVGESGQGMVEYGLILALVSVVVIAMLTGIGNSINNKFTTVNSKLNGQ